MGPQSESEPIAGITEKDPRHSWEANRNAIFHHLSMATNSKGMGPECHLPSSVYGHKLQGNGPPEAGRICRRRRFLNHTGIHFGKRVGERL